VKTDDQQIRQLVADWIAATRNGDIHRVLDLTTDDVVFLVPGQPPMRKQDFAAAVQGQVGASAPAIHAESEIIEIKVLGDWAFMWTRLSVVVTPAEGAVSITRAGHTLSVLRKQDGRWRLARDANLLATVEQERRS
jgi:uncharacterized protein (TIGR02246 family)